MNRCTLHVRKEENVFIERQTQHIYLRLYDVRHMVNDHTDS